ncbi:hypothetical protein ACFWBI_36640 [Streptomyces sp. NPDC059982]|uniref:hypothetical protein n=1 Tax=unclassified Streptomyces TaxID=2593676 RepID=UPI0036C46B69
MGTLTRYETLEPNEDELVSEMIEAMHQQQEKDFPPGATGRAAHAKHTGLVNITFAVEPDLPPHLAIGVFAQPRTYEGWLRFSSGNGSPQSDGVKDLRGAAIKLHDVPGERIPESDEPTTQDFILLNTPAIPLGTVKLFHGVITLGQAKFAAKMLPTHPGVVAGLAKAVITPTSPADIPYWSNVASLLGPDQVVKYVLQPTSTYTSPKREKHEDNYLSDHLQEHLSQTEATFDFMVQVRTDPDAMPVEDIAVRWSEEKAPLVKVATVTIPQQEFRTAARNQLAEELTFSIAHALQEHRPIGAVARARMRIYAGMAAWRHNRDQRTKSV